MKPLPLLFLACLWTAAACAAGDTPNDGELLYNGSPAQSIPSAQKFPL